MYAKLITTTVLSFTLAACGSSDSGLDLGDDIGSEGGGSTGATISLSGADTAIFGNTATVTETSELSSNGQTIATFGVSTGVINLYINSGVLNSMQVQMRNGADIYDYALVCAGFPVECAKISLNAAARTVSFNDVNVSVLAGSSGDNKATDTLTITSATLSWGS